MVNANMINTYRNQQIITSSPEELTLLLYNGAIRFVSESIAGIEQGNIQQSHNANRRAQDIVHELMITLDMRYEIAKTWLPLYEYILYSLIKGNIKKDKEQLLQAKLLISELREAWMAMIKIRGSKQVINSTVDNMVKQLWLDYLLLTKKMLTFLEKQDMDLFYKAMNKRKKLKERIDLTADDGFRHTEEGQRLLFEIRSDSQFIANTLQCQLNARKGQSHASISYDSEIGASVSRMSWEK